MEIRVWKGSTLIGQQAAYIDMIFNVDIIKVARGPNATDSKLIILEDGDYITFKGNDKDCLKLLRATAS